MRNRRVKRKAETFQKRMLLHTMLQQWFSIVLTSKEFVKDSEKKKTYMKVLKASVCTLWNVRSPCKGKMLRISILRNERKGYTG